MSDYVPEEQPLALPRPVRGGDRTVCARASVQLPIVGALAIPEAYQPGSRHCIAAPQIPRGRSTSGLRVASAYVRHQVR